MLILRFLGSYQSQLVIAKVLYCIILLSDMWTTTEFTSQCLLTISRNSLALTQALTLLVLGMQFAISFEAPVDSFTISLITLEYMLSAVFFFFPIEKFSCINCSVGFPYKEAVMKFCDEVHPLAQVDNLPICLIFMLILTDAKASLTPCKAYNHLNPLSFRISYYDDLWLDYRKVTGIWHVIPGWSWVHSHDIKIWVAVRCLWGW